MALRYAPAWYVEPPNRPKLDHVGSWTTPLFATSDMCTVTLYPLKLEWQCQLTGRQLPVALVFAECLPNCKVALCAFENELGVQAPVGFWDPVGFTSDGDVAAFKRRRSVELKHGRISMMATMGALIAISWTS